MSFLGKGKKCFVLIISKFMAEAMYEKEIKEKGASQINLMPILCAV